MSIDFSKWPMFRVEPGGMTYWSKPDSNKIFYGNPWTDDPREPPKQLVIPKRED